MTVPAWECMCGDWLDEDGDCPRCILELCVDGEGCGARGPYTSWCGGCCACRGGCRAGYYEWQEEQQSETSP